MEQRVFRDLFDAGVPMQKAEAVTVVSSTHSGPFGGYTCARCGSFVANGMSHQCLGLGITPSQPYTPPSPPSLKWDRTQEILNAIGALTAAVDRLVEKLS